MTDNRSKLAASTATTLLLHVIHPAGELHRALRADSALAHLGNFRAFFRDEAGSCDAQHLSEHAVSVIDMAFTDLASPGELLPEALVGAIADSAIHLIAEHDLAAFYSHATALVMLEDRDGGMALSIKVIRARRAPITDKAPICH